MFSMYLGGDRRGVALFALDRAVWAQVEKGWEGIKNGERQKQTCVNNYL